MPSKPTKVCPGGCGFAITWHATHCCMKCKSKPSQHGPMCRKLRVSVQGLDQQDVQDASEGAALHHPLPPSGTTSLLSATTDRATACQTPLGGTLPPAASASAGPPTEAAHTARASKSAAGEPAGAAMGSTSPPSHVVAHPSTVSSLTTGTGGGWYPGKHLQGTLRRIKAREREVVEAVARGDRFQLPRRPLCAIRNMALKQKRALRARTDAAASLGNLFVTILGGQFRTKRPYLIAELDGNEFRTTVGTSDTPSWEADAAFPVHDPSSDLRLFLFDDEAIHNERPIGRDRKSVV